MSPLFPLMTTSAKPIKQLYGFRIDPYLLKGLEDLAARRGVKGSVVLRQSLAEYLLAHQD